MSDPTDQYNEAYAVRRARVFGCLYGGAIGDAFGYPFEFMKLNDIEFEYGPLNKLGVINPSNGGKLAVSDDTQMTMFTAEGLIDVFEAFKHPSLGCVHDRLVGAYLDWYDTQRVAGRAVTVPSLTGSLLHLACMRVRRAPGNTCLSALKIHFDAEEHGLVVPDPINDSKGCGAVMRVAPIGLVLAPREAFQVAVVAGQTTHGHPSGYLSAGFLAALISVLVTYDPGADFGDTLTRALIQVAAILKEYPGHKEVLNAVTNARSLASSTASPGVSDLGGGWVGEEALAIGVYAALRGEDLEHALRIATLHDGDSDSTASIAGQLWGTFHGLTPMQLGVYVERLDVVKPLTRLAEALVTVNR